MHSCKETITIPSPGRVVEKSNTYPATRTNKKPATPDNAIQNETDIKTQKDKVSKSKIEESNTMETLKQIKAVPQSSKTKWRQDNACSEPPINRLPSTKCCVINDESNENTTKPYYVNIAGLTESDHIYDIPKTAIDESEENVFAKTMPVPHNVNNTGDNELQAEVTSNQTDSENIYIDASSTDHFFNEDVQEMVYETTTQSSAKPLYIEILSSLPDPPSFTQEPTANSESGENSNDDVEDAYVLPDHVESPSADGDNEYIFPDPMESTSNSSRKSATVAPFMPQTDTRTTIVHPRTRPFLIYTVEEVVDCFEECALPHLANICKEENLDGDYFKDLSDADLSREPFLLNQFHISKVRKIIAGWRPKRLSRYRWS